MAIELANHDLQEIVVFEHHLTAQISGYHETYTKSSEKSAVVSTRKTQCRPMRLFPPKFLDFLMPIKAGGTTLTN